MSRAAFLAALDREIAAAKLREQLGLEPPGHVLRAFDRVQARLDLEIARAEGLQRGEVSS